MVCHAVPLRVVPGPPPPPPPCLLLLLLAAPLAAAGRRRTWMTSTPPPPHPAAPSPRGHPLLHLISRPPRLTATTCTQTLSNFEWPLLNYQRSGSRTMETWCGAGRTHATPGMNEPSLSVLCLLHSSLSTIIYICSFVFFVFV